jgi:pimeloyl-ACP methyl ester carboxylesterase
MTLKAAAHSPGRRFRRGFIRTVSVILVIVVLAVTALLVYASMVMPGDRLAAIDAWDNPALSITSTDHSIVIEPTGQSSGVGLVYIPGAKVDSYAYLYKLSGLVETDGMTVVVTKPTLNLAFFDQRPLSTFTDDAPTVDRWFVGGHSLGGVRACQLADSPAVDGLMLFASYCANDLSTTDLAVLSIAASNDGLTTAEKIEAAAPRLPPSTMFVIIEGGNHAGFGDYGNQSGDREATLTSIQIRDAITTAVGVFIAP